VWKVDELFVVRVFADSSPSSGTCATFVLDDVIDVHAEPLISIIAADFQEDSGGPNAPPRRGQARPRGKRGERPRRPSREYIPG